MSTLYETDPSAWAERQIEALRRLADLHPELLAELDVDHLVEELDDMKKSLMREITSRLTIILQHLAKWRWQPALQTRSWQNSIAEQRDQVALLIRNNPSLHSHLNDLLADAWHLARRRAHRETGLAQDTFPDDCPFTVEQTLTDGWMPG